ncbi:Peptide-N(4)-(N-acetyl-beta- glucosaminyl)asparagine amidase [Gonapodya sp. JEL0774]|nr:Peptide-N(4)-(N-acetyl-beta- glucosaminyl)asparagine amidase [Gonapodya sp. JEL0774]
MSQPALDVNELAADLTARFLARRLAAELQVPAQSSAASTSSAPIATTSNPGSSSTSASSMPAMQTPVTKFPREETEMRKKLRDTMVHCQVYEMEDLLEKARSVVPVERLHEETNLAMKEEKGTFEVNLLKRLLLWFKNDFFTWTNNPPCRFCQSSSTRAVGPATPSGEELRWGGNRVELYACDAENCARFTRFPRYNNPEKLLETRTGRCGEWANCFTLITRALGFESRYVLDWTDHVWTEVWIEEQPGEGRWVHTDPCEAAYNVPLIYEKGWGKKLSYIFSFSHVEVTDVIRRYSRNVPDVLTRRTDIPEEALAKIVQQLNKENISTLPPTLRSEILARRQSDKRDLETCHLRAASWDPAESKGRTSGSLEWRLARGEIRSNETQEGGTKGVPASAPARSTKPGTLAYCMPRTIFPESFSETQLDSGWCLNASAQPSCLHGAPLVPTASHLCASAIQLTPCSADKRGTAFLRSKVSSRGSWSVEFGIRVTSESGGSAEGGADGLALVAQSHGVEAVGNHVGGSGLGVRGIPNALSVEFDTFGSRQLTVRANGKELCSSKRIPTINDGKVYFAKVVVTNGDSDQPTEQWLEVFITDKSAGNLESCTTEGPDPDTVINSSFEGADWVKVTECGLSVHEVVRGDEFWLGFTAATGGLCERHEVFGVVVRVGV